MMRLHIIVLGSVALAIGSGCGDACSEFEKCCEDELKAYHAQKHQHLASCDTSNASNDQCEEDLDTYQKLGLCK